MDKRIKNTAGGSHSSGGSTNKKPQNITLKRNAKKSQYKLFMTLTIGGGVVVCILVFYIMFSMFSEPSGAAGTALSNAEPKKPEMVVEEPKENIVITGVIKELNAAGSTVSIYDTERKSIDTYKASGLTELRNRFGEVLSFVEFRKGDIVTVESSEGNKLVSLKISNDAVTRNNVTNLKINSDVQTVSIGNDTYAYDEQLVAIADGEDFDIAKISTVDVLTLRIYKNKLYTVILDKGHGFIQITNKSKIREGILEIDNSIYKSLAEADKIEASTGIRRVVVKGANIEPFVQEVDVRKWETVQVDLGKVQSKTGVLILRLDPSDSEVYIDGEKINNTDEPVVLDYGKYNVQVKKEGFEPSERDVTIAEPSLSMRFTLTKNVKMGTLSITTEPVGAHVYIDNFYIGISPISQKVEYGNHKILCKMDGYTDFIMAVDVANDRDSYTFHMQPLSNIPDTTQTTKPQEKEPPRNQETETNPPESRETETTSPETRETEANPPETDADTDTSTDNTNTDTDMESSGDADDEL